MIITPPFARLRCSLMKRIELCGCPAVRCTQSQSAQCKATNSSSAYLPHVQGPNGRSDLQLVGSFVASSFLITISDRLIFHNLWIPKLLIYLLGRHVGLKRINYTTNKFYWNQRLFFFWQQRKVWFVFNQKMEKRIFIRRILFLFNFFYFIIE